MHTRRSSSHLNFAAAGGILVAVAGSCLMSATPGLAAPAQGPAASTKVIIEKQDDLPRHSYTLEHPVAEYFSPEHRGDLLALARALREDVEADLQRYDIQDSNTVQSFYGLLGSIALLEEDWAGYLDFLSRRRALETKEANRLTMGLVGEALATARLAGSDSTEAVGEILEQNLRALPYATVEAELEGLKGSTEILSRALVLGSLESSLQPIAERNNGVVSYDVAESIVSASFTLDQFLPLATDINGILSTLIDSSRVDKPDIWAARQFDLAASDQAEPVTLAIWDSGVDTAIFAASGQLWENTNEVPGNGIDDDNNGYTDDVHGIAYDLQSNKMRELLYPIAEFANTAGGSTGDEASLQRLIKGLGDLQFNVASDEATEVRQRMASLPQDEVQTFLESLSVYGNYSHGTHVAGIAAAGNPFARLLVGRITFAHKLVPERPTLAGAHRDAAQHLETVEYFRRQGVRVANLSWGGSLRGIEQALEANPEGESVETRKQMAREIYAITDKALRRAIQSSPDILFVISAGNSDNDIRFDEYYPSSYDYPNVLTVGAVDGAGDETSFTSLGKVDVYGNGFEVESYVPGGNRIAFNGTSMSSPQVTNLAGKLLARYPDLNVAQLKALIIDGAEEKALDARTILLIDPKRSMQLAQIRSAQGPQAQE